MKLSAKWEIFIFCSAFALGLYTIHFVPSPFAKLKGSQDFASESAPPLRDSVLEIFHRAQKAKSLGDYLQKTPSISSLERKLILKKFPAETTLPLIELRLASRPFSFRVGRVNFEIVQAHRGEFRVQGQNFQWNAQKSWLENAQALSPLVDAPPLTSQWIQFLIPQAQASNEIQTACFSEAELLWVDPSRLEETSFGYLTTLLGASILDQAFQHSYARLATPSCQNQVSELKKILKDHKLALQSVDCGTNHRGDDRSFIFWTSEQDEDGELVSREFLVDHRARFVQEVLPEDEPDKRKKNRQARPIDVFQFDSVRLQEVRRIEEKNETRSCQSIKPGHPEYKKLEATIEPFRSVFDYIGTNYTCLKCYKELELLALKSPPASLHSKPAQSPPSSEDSENDDSEGQR